MESRKMVLTNLLSGQKWRCRHREQTNGRVCRGKEENEMEEEEALNWVSVI